MYVQFHFPYPLALHLTVHMNLSSSCAHACVYICVYKCVCVCMRARMCVRLDTQNTSKKQLVTQLGYSSPLKSFNKKTK